MSRLVFVTGGSRGIGKGIVQSLVKNGYDVAFSYSTNLSSANLVLKELSSDNAKVMAVQMNVESRSSVQHAINEVIEHLGTIDILVNNAAIAQEKPFDAITDDDWDNMMAVNLRGPFSVVQELLPYMLKNKWGRIINISSIGGQWGGFNQVHYAATKAALINFTKSIAKIYSHNGITSNAISPGLVATDMSENELNTDAGKKKVEGIPAKRLGTIDEVGSSVVYLASDEAGYITGQTINVNGGMYFS
jgi:NAD(P)-dependent dehydrogenase (short-subunit alcohol dehydrogenase family)